VVVDHGPYRGVLVGRPRLHRLREFVDPLVPARL
jgi:hypothetical protein